MIRKCLCSEVPRLLNVHQGICIGANNGTLDIAVKGIFIGCVDIARDGPKVRQRNFYRDGSNPRKAGQ